MKILMASTPLTGHLNPLLAVGHVLMAEGHELVVLSGSWLQDRGPIGKPLIFLGNRCISLQLRR
jgi:hypothetical protein